MLHCFVSACRLTISASTVDTELRNRSSNSILLLLLLLMMLFLKAVPLSSPSTFSSYKHLRHLPYPPSLKPYAHSSPSTFRSSTTASSSTRQTIEHIVLFRVKDDTHPSKVNAMVRELRSLVSLNEVRHLTVGPLLRNRYSAFAFTHMLHSRYNSKDDLSAYSAHPSHLRVAKGSVYPICDDIMALDWVSRNLDAGDLVPLPGSAIRVRFLKLKENSGDEVKREVLGVMGGGSRVVSYGENFSPGRAKGFSIASVEVFPGQTELEAVDSSEKEEKVREHAESVLEVDYVVPSAQAQPAASLDADEVLLSM